MTPGMLWLSQLCNLFIPLLNSSNFSPWGTLKTLITVPYMNVRGGGGGKIVSKGP